MAKNTGIAQFAQGRSDVHRIDPKIIVIAEGWNGRDENPELNAHIDQLALSIAKIGVKKPLEVRLENGQLIVKDGHCRLRAVMLAIKNGADIKTVPVVTVDRYASDEDLILNQVISNSGKPLTTMEQARVFKKLLDFGWNQGDIADKVGLSNGRISQILDLLTMPASVQTLVAQGSISAALASSTVKAAASPTLAAESLQEAANRAAEAGRKKVKPADVVSGEPKMTLKMAFENSEIDDENMNQTGYVDIRMCVEDFRFICDVLKL